MTYIIEDIVGGRMALAPHGLVLQGAPQVNSALGCHPSNCPCTPSVNPLGQTCRRLEPVIL